MRAWLPLRPLLRSNRAFCTQLEGHTPTLKGELRRLFKLVHPDLFQNQPVEQAINQHSFQLLQEYLSAAKGVGSSQQYPYHFLFFIRQDADVESLKKVEISLPPPQVRYHDEKGTEILPTTRISIARLLSACGLSMNVSGGLTDNEDLVCLSELFRQASEIQRQNDACAVDLERRLAVVKNALGLGRGIRVAFRPPLSELSCRDQLEELERLAKALDRSQDVKLTGHLLLIGDCYGVDAVGNLWLRYKDDVQSWSNFFHTADLEKAVKNQRETTLRRALELKVARLMEVEMIFTHDALAIQPDYYFFLNKIAEEAALRGAVGAGKFSQLPIRVTCPEQGLDTYADNLDLDEVSCMKVDQTFGYIAVPVWQSVCNIYKYIEECGEEALKVRDRLKHSEKHVEQVKFVARKKLRLRHLMFDRKLRNEMCIAACMRLIHFAPELEKHMEGLSLCISDENRLPIEGAKSFLHLKWNFSLSEL